MNFESSFTFITEDDDWLKKLGIGILLMFTGIGNIAVIGWLGELIKRVSEDSSDPLPGWEDIGDYFMNGLKVFGVTFIWSFPIIILYSLFSFYMIFSNNGYLNVNQVEPGLIIALLCISFIVIIYALLLTLLTAPLYGLISEDISFGKMLNPQTSFDYLKANFWGYILSFLVGALITFVLSFFGIFLCGIGFYFGGMYGYVVMGHLMGQAHGQAKRNLNPGL